MRRLASVVTAAAGNNHFGAPNATILTRLRVVDLAVGRTMGFCH